MSWTNADGLTVLMHGEQGEVKAQGLTAEPMKKYLVLDIADATEIPSSAAAPAANDPFIPAGSFITGAWVIVETAFTSGGAATLTIGTQNAAGTAIDADGIDAAVALAALAADTGVVCDGAQVAGTALVTADAYLSFNYGTAAYTAGAAKVVVEYIEV